MRQLGVGVYVGPSTSERQCSGQWALMPNQSKWTWMLIYEARADSLPVFYLQAV